MSLVYISIHTHMRIFMDLCTRVLTYMYNYIHNTSNHILLFPKSWNAVTVTNTITSESHIWIYVHIHVCTFACMYEHVYVYTNMYTYTHTHQRVTYLFSRNAKIAAAVTGTITSESHANTRSHTANTYWFGFILIFFFFFQNHKQVPRYTHNRFSGSDPVQNPLKYGCLGWPGRREGLPSTSLWISAAVLAQLRSCACTVTTGDQTWETRRGGLG